MNRSELRAQAAPFLLWLAFKGPVTQEDIARRWADDPNLDALLSTLHAGGLIGEIDDCIYLEDPGDELLHEACHDTLTEAEQSAMADFMAKFDPIDNALKAAVTRWQEANPRPGALNKEALGAVDDWMDAHDRLQQAVASSESVVTKVLEGHLRGLDDAVARFEAGHIETFSGGGDDSYHSRWFVMHELLLRSIGTRR